MEVFLRQIRTPALCGWLCILVAAVCLLGWATDDLRLASFLPDQIMMAPSTAVCFVVLGWVQIVLSLRNFRTAPVPRWIDTSILVVVGIALVELGFYLSGGDSFLDRQLSGSVDRIGTIPIGRMSSVTALMFLLSSAGLLHLRQLPPRWRSLHATLAATGALAVVLGAGMLTIGYAYGVPFFHRDGFVPPAFPTVVAFFFLNLGAFRLAGEDSNLYRELFGPSVFASLIRSLVPGITGFILLEGWFAAHGYRFSHNPAINHAVLSLGLVGLVFLVVYSQSRRISRQLERAARENEAKKKDLEASDARFRQAVENAPFPIILHAEDGEVLAISEGWTYSSGYELRDIPTIGDWSAAAYGERREIVQLDIERLYGRTGRIDEGEYVIRCKDGTPRTWEFSSAPLGRLPDGRRAVISMAKDVTERKSIEASIAAEKEQLAVTLRCIGDGVITTDTTGRIAIMNQVAEDLTGWTADEALGRSLSEVYRRVDRETRDPVPEPLGRILASGCGIELSDRAVLLSRRGLEREIDDSGAPIRDGDGRIIGVVVVFRDITEKHRMQESLQRIEKLDSLGVLAGGISHDFNNLLAGLFGYLEMAREQVAQGSTVAGYLDKASTVFARAKDLTHQLLTFSKGGAPKRKTGWLGERIEPIVKFALSGSNVQCVFRIAPDLWPCDYDENQIAQVLDNLVINAQQAMPRGGTISIEVENVSIRPGDHPILTRGDFIRIAIADTGEGIPAELLKRIFDPFFTTKQRGNGLGLATCYSIVQKHEGSIDVQSEVGRGSVFRIHLPASENRPTTQEEGVVAPHAGRGRILVMDDEPFIREILGGILESLGYSCLEASNGEEALRLFGESEAEGNPVLAAFFDLTIPGGMGGKEAILLLRTARLDVPVFASSGFSDDPIIARPTEFGFTDSIGKPFRKADLVEVLNRHLGGGRSSGAVDRGSVLRA